MGLHYRKRFLHLLENCKADLLRAIDMLSAHILRGDYQARGGTRDPLYSTDRDFVVCSKSTLANDKPFTINMNLQKFENPVK